MDDTSGATPQTRIMVDGHVHITNRVYWEGIDPWDPQPFGFDYARAAAAGANVIIENVAPYGFGNFNYTPKQTLRLIETFHRVAERHADRMAIALTAAEARQIVAGGRLAVFLGIESGFDHEGDPDVLGALYRLGLRTVQFATQTCFNAFADSEAGGPPVWNGINSRGRELIAAINELGILIDITHATVQAQEQIINASQAPVAASHVSLAAVSGTGMPDSILRALADKGGMIGITGTSASLTAGYRQWLAAHPDKQAAVSAIVTQLVNFTSSLTRAPRDHGEFGQWLDDQLRTRHRLGFSGPWTEDPEAAALVRRPMTGRRTPGTSSRPPGQTTSASGSTWPASAAACRRTRAATPTSSPPWSGSQRRTTSPRSPARTGCASWKPPSAGTAAGRNCWPPWPPGTRSPAGRPPRWAPESPRKDSIRPG